MIITYYTIADFRYKDLPGLYDFRDKNFASKEKVKEVIKNNYKFEPYLCINRFGDLFQYKEVIEKVPVYSEYKSGKNKGQFILKNGEKIVSYYNEHKYGVKTNDYSEFNQNYNDFEKNSGAKGYYELKYDNHSVTENENSIKYSCQVFIRFIECKRNYVSEVKEPSKPYVPANKTIEKIKESEWFPLYQCKKYDSLSCGINNDMDNWSRTELVFIHYEVFVEENKIEIID
jgi:hypothetical protein